MPAAKKAQPVEIEVGGRSVRVSSPDRIVFPGVDGAPALTKLDVVRYFADVAEGITGALLHRPTTLERWPKGWSADAVMATRADSHGDAFYQKRIPKGAPDWVETARIAFPSGRTADEVCPTEPAVAAWAAQIGTLTFHPWPVRSGHGDASPADGGPGGDGEETGDLPWTERVDQLRIDLDPQPGTDFDDAAAVAPHLRELLTELGMTGYPKTSGGRGLHVFVPLAPEWTFTQARRATIAIGRELERRLPDQVTTKWWKEERGEKVFVDYNQMARDRTIASAWSIRANARATVSMPLSWDEVDQVHPDDFHVRSAPARLAEVGDLFAPLRADRDPSLDCDLRPALDLADRDEAEGLGDLPYPPEYPKQPGEPKRVQPSRDRNRRHQDGPDT